MRFVKWHTTERVDLPDMQAVSSLVVGEFRRLVRGLFLGDLRENVIVKGFKVEAQDPVSTIVTVSLDPDGDGSNLGFLIGAEDVGTRIDYGQLVGGDDMAGNLEGNAQQVIDFSGQPNGDYDIYVKFSYTTGISDSRIFRNEGTDTEYSQSVDTRYIPVWQVKPFGDPVTDAHILLATVTYDGGNIGQQDIADKRYLFFEGQGQPSENPLSQFETADRSTFSPFPDFDRTNTRAVNGIGAFGLKHWVNIVSRQIQDLKGPSSSGYWNFFGRLQKPIDPKDSIPDTETRGLSTIDTMEFLVGDGTTTVGDFDSLQDCLNHIATWHTGGAASSTYPQKVRIRLKSLTGKESPPEEVWSLFTPVELGAITLEIVGDIGPAHGIRGLFDTTPPMSVPIRFGHGSGYYFTSAFDDNANSDDQTKVIFRNIDVIEASSGLFDVHGVELHNSKIKADAIDIHMAYTNSQGLQIFDTVLERGIWCFKQNPGKSGFPVAVMGDPGIVKRSLLFAAHIRCWDDARNSVTDIDTVTNICKDLSFEDVHISAGGYIITPDASSFPSFIDFRGAEHIRFKNLYVLQQIDLDALLGGIAGKDFGVKSNFDVKIDQCFFDCNVTSSSGHLYHSGLNGTYGTGWSIRFDASTIDTISQSSHFNRGIYVTDCLWEHAPVRDAGCVQLLGCRQCVIDGNTVDEIKSANDINQAANGQGFFFVYSDPVTTGLSLGNKNISITNNKVGNRNYATSVPVGCFHVYLVGIHRNTSIENNDFDNLVTDFSDPRAGVTAAVQCNGDVFVTIANNRFTDFDNTILFSGTTFGTITGNMFQICQTCVQGPSADAVYLNISNNKYQIYTDDVFFDGGSITAASELTICNNNATASESLSGSWNVIDLGPAETVVLMGNSFPPSYCNIATSALGGITNNVGYNSSPDLNICLGYV